MVATTTMTRMYLKKRERNKAISSLAKSVMASKNVVNNDNIVFFVKIENRIVKENIITETCIHVKVEE